MESFKVTSDDLDKDIEQSKKLIREFCRDSLNKVDRESLAKSGNIELKYLKSTLTKTDIGGYEHWLKILAFIAASQGKTLEESLSQFFNISDQPFKSIDLQSSSIALFQKITEYSFINDEIQEQIAESLFEVLGKIDIEMKKNNTKRKK